MACPTCANSLPDGSVFCARCGWSAYAAPADSWGGPPTPGYAPTANGGPYAMPYGAPPRRTNGMAIGSLCTSVGAAVLAMATCGLGAFIAPVGAILGHVALNQMKGTDEEGRGMALAGVIVGWVLTGLAVIGLIVVIAIIAASDTST